MSLVAGPLLLGALGACAQVRPVDMSPYLPRFAPADRPVPVPEPGRGQLAVTYFGVSTMMFDDGVDQIMIDGFLTRARLPRLATPASTNALAVDHILHHAGVDRLRALFVAHSHFDHAFDSAYVARSTGALLYGSQSTLNIGRGGGVPSGRLRPFEVGRPVQFRNMRVTVLPSVHSPPSFYNNNIGQVISEELRQPAHALSYREGGSYAFLIEHRDRRFLVLPAAGYCRNGLEGVQADMLFLSVGTLGNQSQAYRDEFYAETVGRVRPQMIVPIHWDSFLVPLAEPLRPPPRALDRVDAALDFLTRRADADRIPVVFLQGGQRLELHGQLRGNPQPRQIQFTPRNLSPCPPEDRG